MTLKAIMQTQIKERADFLRARPEYRKATPGTMIRTMHEATMMKAWSPDWYHWFRFSVAGHPKLLALRIPYGTIGTQWQILGVSSLLESPPVSGSVPLNVVGAPTHEYDMVECSGRCPACFVAAWKEESRELGKAGEEQRRTGDLY